jgi:hypothetical protein
MELLEQNVETLSSKKYRNGKETTSYDLNAEFIRRSFIKTNKCMLTKWLEDDKILK